VKFPRWLVITLLSASVLASLGAGAWFWVTWPERTAQEFVRRLAHNESWTELLGPEWNSEDNRSRSVLTLLLTHAGPQSWSEVTPQPRDIFDVLVGRQRFKTSYELKWEFTTNRGTLILPSLDMEMAHILSDQLRQVAGQREALRRVKSSETRPISK
jgi:hypothetical protein